MPLLLFCLLACFHRDVPADMSEQQKYDFVSGGVKVQCLSNR